ncbi:unnamed protein product, partial [Symbiodinium sp. CCMP2592]
MCASSLAASAESVATLDAPTRIWGDWKDEDEDEDAEYKDSGDDALHHPAGEWGDDDGQAESWVADAGPENPWSTGDQDDTWGEASADSDPKNPWPADEGWDNTWVEDFPDPTNDEIYESFIQTMGIDLDEEARLHTPSFRTNNTIAVDLVQEQPEQPDEGQNDDLVNHDMQEAKEGVTDIDERERERERELVLASKQPVEYQKPKGTATKPHIDAQTMLLELEPDLKLKNVRDRWWVSDERTTVLSTIPVKEQKK